MILKHIVDMPRLYSGRDNKGREWTALLLPRAFSQALSAMPGAQRVKTLRGLYADFRRSVDG